jgi:hypothetical protein
MTKKIKNIKEIGIDYKEDENGNVIISANDALKHAGDIWGEEVERKENPDTDQDNE